MFTFDLTDWYEDLVAPGTHEFEVIAFDCDNTAKTITMTFAVEGTDIVHEERFHLLNRNGQKNRIGINSVLNMLKAIFPDVRITNITEDLLETSIGRKFIGEIAHHNGADGRKFANLLYYKYEPYQEVLPTGTPNKTNIQNLKNLLNDDEK